MPRTILLNNCLLFLCCSIYLGTGVSLAFFQFPLEPQLTVENYQLVLMQPVMLATKFFTYMTIVMLVTASIMLASEWFSGIRWVPACVLMLIIAATALTVFAIFDVNQALNDGVDDPEALRLLLREWIHLNTIRISLWALQWLAMMYWFYALAFKARSDR
jgi:hypothetical protein